MSRSLLVRTFALGLVIVAAACSNEGHTPATALVDSHAEPLSIAQSVTPSSVGWNERARVLVGQANMSPLAASRVYAALGVAQYRALRAVPDADGDGEAPENGIGAGGRSALEFRRGAVAGASATVLGFLFSGAASSLEARAVAEGSAGSGLTHPHFELGVDAGRQAGAAMVDHLKSDHFTAPWTGTVPTGPGMWIANGTPAGGTFSGVTPYFLNSANQFRPAPPPAWQSDAFLADLAEIKALSDNRTAAHGALAIQWNYATGSFTPPGYWNLVASQYIAEHGLDELGAARVYALTGGAMMDALIACWDAKYFHWTIRPTQANSAITLVFPLPNHPSYPSGHSCVSAAAATTLGAFFPEHSAQLDEWVTEAGLSRMHAGIHYRFDITAGANLGIDVARWALANEQRIE
ncbi:MAG: vanadium-dependent haloperoxidase [Gemmatimonadaceae bacterium]